MGQIISDQKSWIDRSCAFLKPVLLVMTKPRAFFSAYFHQPGQLEALRIPFSRVLRRTGTAGHTVMPPLRCLGAALGILGAVAVLQGFVVELVLPDELVHAMQGSERSAEAFFERVTGHHLVTIDTQHLTGFAPVDEPAGEYIQLFRYLYFAALFALFLGRRAAMRNTIDYFAYTLSASVVLVSVAIVASIAVFVLLAVTPDAAFAFSGLVELIGWLPMLFYCLVLPIIIFPSVFGVARRSVVRATLLAVAAWVGTNLLLTQGLLMQLGIMVKW